MTSLRLNATCPPPHADIQDLLQRRATTRESNPAVDHVTGTVAGLHTLYRTKTHRFIILWHVVGFQGTAEVKAQLKKNTHTLVMSTPQMVVLLLFNDADHGKLTAKV